MTPRTRQLEPVLWRRRTTVRGIFLSTDAQGRYGYVATDKSATHVKRFSLQGNLARELTEVSPGTLLIITCLWTAPRKTPVFMVQRSKRQLFDAGLLARFVELGALTAGHMSMGARIERMLASRLVELERLLDDKDRRAPELWDEYYRAADLWLRSRAPVPSSPQITKAQLAERFPKR